MSEPMIDWKRLPERALLDTMVVASALGDNPHRLLSPICRAIWSEMLKSGKTILIAAPTIAELMRSDRPTSVPRHRLVEVVDFDRRCAEIIGQRLPHTILESTAKAMNVPRHYIKYDALIVACAVIHRADVIISDDGGMRTLAQTALIGAQEPSYYEEHTLFSNLPPSS